MPPKLPALAHKPYWIAAALAVMLFLGHFFHILDFHELEAVDLRLQLRGERPALRNIVLLEIDDTSLASIGEWPWPRKIYAALLEVLSSFDPALIFFDILFTEAAPDPADDQALSGAIGHNGHVVLPFFYSSEKPFQAKFPLKALEEAALATGFVNVDPDRDGIIRHFRAYLDTGEKRYYHPALIAALRTYPDARRAGEWFAKLPVDRGGRLWLNYPGTIRSFQRFSFWQVIQSLKNEEDDKLRALLKDSYIIVGHSATGTTDLRATPFSAVEPGLAIQAAAFQTLLTGRFLCSSPWWLDLLIFLAAALGVTWLARKFSPRHGILLTLGLLAAYPILNFLIFLFRGWILPFFGPLAVMASAYGAALFIQYLQVRITEELLHRELATAARIQSNFLPPADPVFPGLEVRFQCRFIKQVGGDLYDWIPLADGQFGVCLGDVSGKGMPAALYMAKALSEFRRDPKIGLPPSKVVNSLNDHLAKSGQSGMFLTLFYAVLDTYKQKVSFVSAGQDPMVFYRAQTQQAEFVEEAQGSPAGLFEGTEYDEFTMSYQHGDLLVVVTDGIKELRNLKKEEFGMERLRLCVAEAARLGYDAAKVIEHVFEAMKAYQKGEEPHDDRTILCVRFL